MAQAPASSPSLSSSPGETDPSMDDILASIRRILSDEEKSAKQSTDGVLVLDPSMMVEATAAPEASGHSDIMEELQRSAPAPTAAPQTISREAPPPVIERVTEPVIEPVIEPVVAPGIDRLPEPLIEATPPPSRAAPSPAPASPTMPSPAPPPPGPASTGPGSEPLVAPAAAAAAATSVSTLMRTLAAERSAAVGRGGLTIEDIVREEIRPLLKSWLDAHLPPVVERLVQAEIERVVGRTGV